MDVGVRELQQHLSEYLDRASRGEVFRVTDRGRPKAVLGPLLGGGGIERGIAEGWLGPGEDLGPLAPATPVPGARTVADVLTDDRGE